MVACGLVAIFTILNSLGVRRTARIQNVLTATKVGVILVFICAGFAFGSGSWEHFSQTAVRTSNTPLFSQFVVSLVYIYVGYSGWNAATYVAEEVRQPARTLPLSLAWGTALVAALFLGLNVLYIYAVPLESMKGVVAVGAQAASALFGPAVAGLFSVGVEEPYRWKDSVQAGPEVRIWALDGIANGFRPWFAKFSAVLYDRRWLKTVEDLYVWHHRNERYLRNEEPLVRVGLVYSQQTAWFYGGPRARATVEDHALGWYQALIEARIPFEMVHDRLLDWPHIEQFKTLILPNIAALSDDQCNQLRTAVQRGISLIATHETSLYDEWGTKRENFGLADLFGVDYAGRTIDRMQNAYLRLEHTASNGHDLLRGLEDAPRIIHGVSRVELSPRQAFPGAPLTLIPSYPDLPMEKVYPRRASTYIPQVFLRQTAGRVCYFPWDITALFGRSSLWIISNFCATLSTGLPTKRRWLPCPARESLT